MKNTTFNAIKKSVASLLVICFAVIFVSPAFAEEKEESRPKNEATAKYTDKMYYRWTKYKRTAKGDGTYNEIKDFLGTNPSFPKKGIIVFNSNATSPDSGYNAYLSSTNKLHFTDESDGWLQLIDKVNVAGDHGMTLSGETFVTETDLGAWEFVYAEDDPKNADTPRYYLQFPRQNGIVLAGWDSARTYFRKVDINEKDEDGDLIDDNRQPWSFVSSHPDDPSIINGYVKIINEVGNALEDQYLGFSYNDDEVKPGYFYATWDADWEDRTLLEIYICEEIPYSRITYDYTIQPGYTLNVKDSSVLESGCSITVSKDAVLSIQGQFYNNGTIKNYGTIVIQDDSAMSPFGNKNKELGSVLNYGGDVVMMKGAKMYIKQGAQLALTEGSTLVNAGTLIVGGTMDIVNATLDNRDNGTVLLGYTVEENVSYLRSLEVKFDTDDGFARFRGMGATYQYPNTSDLYFTSQGMYNHMKNYSTYLGKGAKIDNSGKIQVTHTVFNGEKELDYNKKKNGSIYRVGTLVDIMSRYNILKIPYMKPWGNQYTYAVNNEYNRLKKSDEWWIYEPLSNNNREYN